MRYIIPILGLSLTIFALPHAFAEGMGLQNRATQLIESSRMVDADQLVAAIACAQSLKESRSTHFRACSQLYVNKNLDSVERSEAILFYYGAAYDALDTALSMPGFLNEKETQTVVDARTSLESEINQIISTGVSRFSKH